MAIMTHVISKGDDESDDNCGNKFHIWITGVKYAIGVISFACFAYQTYNVTDQYLANKTVVTTILEKPNNVTIPAVTVCVPVLMPFRKLCQSSESDLECTKRLEMTANLTLNTTNDKNKWNLIRAEHENKLITDHPLRDIIDDSLLDIIVGCRIAREHEVIDTHVRWQDCVLKPIPSIIYITKTSKSGQLCSTIFSRFDPNYSESKHNIFLKNFGNALAFMAFDIQNDKWYQSNSKQNGVRVAVHPNNVIPSDIDSKFMKIMPNKAYVIEYSYIISKLLEPPYVTDCRKYGQSPMSRGDCVQKCIFAKAWDPKAGCRLQWNVIAINDIDVNVEKLCAHNWLKDLDKSDVREKCEASCPPDCDQQDYDVRIELSEDSNVRYDGTNSSAQIVLRKQTRADMRIIHSPEMTFPGYVAYVGGLAGIYLGLSILALYDIITAIAVYIASIQFGVWREYRLNKKT